MASGKINEQILQTIREHAEDDLVLQEFLIELLYEEAEHVGRWRAKNVYDKKVEKFAKKWGKDLED